MILFFSIAFGILLTAHIGACLCTHTPILPRRIPRRVGQIFIALLIALAIAKSSYAITIGMYGCGDVEPYSLAWWMMWCPGPSH